MIIVLAKKLYFNVSSEPNGYRFANFSKEVGGLLIYSYTQPPTAELDQIAFGVMTKQQTDATLLRLFSETFSDFITFRLVSIFFPLFFILYEHQLFHKFLILNWLVLLSYVICYLETY